MPRTQSALSYLVIALAELRNGLLHFTAPLFHQTSIGVDEAPAVRKAGSQACIVASVADGALPACRQRDLFEERPIRFLPVERGRIVI